MSYVLEALKKRESEENPDVAVSVSLSAERKRRYRLLTWLVGAALVINAGLLFWLLAWPRLEKELQQEPWQPATENSPANAPTAPLAAPAPAAQQETAAQQEAPAARDKETAAQDKETAAQAKETAAQAKETTAKAKETAAQRTETAAKDPETTAEPERQRVQLDKLPSDVRGRFPGLAFSTHIYAEDKDLRAVVANGQRLMEGDSLRGVTVEQITETGVILGFERYLIEVPVVGYWE